VAWLILIVAGLLEVVWSVGLKYTHGFARLVPSAITVVALIASVVLLERAARVIPVGTAYAVWVGIGVVGVAIAGVVLFAEPMPPLRILFTTMLIVSIIGLKLTAH
jgi:quaternary ammonium compound-resistance protein SugE